MKRAASFRSDSSAACDILRCRRLTALISALYCWTLLSNLKAQEPVAAESGAPPLVIRTETRLVLVDVVVREKKGTEIDLPSGKYNVRVAFGSGGESLGKVEAPLTIDAWDGRSLALSGIALSRNARKASDLAAELDPSLLESNKPLIARSLEIMPSGDNRCRSTEPCFGYLELYDSEMASPNSRAPRLSIKVLDRQSKRALKSGELDIASFVRPASSSVPFILPVPVQQLSGGAYTLEIRASSGTRSAFRSVEFEVE
jgi:hypothetical protein